MRLSVTPGRSEIEQSTPDVVAFPVLIAVVLVAIVVSQLFAPQPSTIVFVVCAVAAGLDVLFVRYCVRRRRATFVVTPSEITFTPAHGASKASPPRVLEHSATSTLTFRLRSNGFIGGQIQYVLKLRDTATGQEVPAGTFGRRRVRQACEAQGWRFS